MAHLATHTRIRLCVNCGLFRNLLATNIRTSNKSNFQLRNLYTSSKPASPNVKIPNSSGLATTPQSFHCYRIYLGDLTKALQPQVDKIPRDAQWLSIEGEVPTNEEWKILGSHFTSVQNLEIDAGFNESLNDRLMPENWPLKRLFMSSSSAEVIENPHILLGKVQRLILVLTMGLRFEGPSANELYEAHREAVKAGLKDEHYVSKIGIPVIHGPRLAQEWMMAKYAGKDIEISSDAPHANPDIRIDTDRQVAAAKSGSYNLRKLEILENDAMETFIRFTIALPRLTHNLRTLNIRSTNNFDLNELPEDLFIEMLSKLDQLETLVLTLGEMFEKDDTLPMIYKSLPKNLRKLVFRGPISLTKHSEWDNWVAKFGDPDFLPNLECLTVVCDLAYGRRGEGDRERYKRTTTEHELRQSKEQCERLLAAARGRQQRGLGKQIVIKPPMEEWSRHIEFLSGVNPLWESV